MAGFSGWSKRIPRRTYRERSQTKDRSSFGVLEKHKDYVVRARMKQKAEKRRKYLKQVIALKNPDEYTTEMNNATKDSRFGKTIVQKIKIPELKPHEKEMEPWKHAEVKKLAKEEKPRKEQKEYVEKQARENLNILNIRLAKVRKEIEMLKHELPAVGVTMLGRNARDEQGNVKEVALNRHVVFVKNRKKLKQFNPEKYFDTDPALAGNIINRPRKETLMNAQITMNNVVKDKAHDRNLKEDIRASYDHMKELKKIEKLLTSTIQDVQHSKYLALYGDKIKKVIMEGNEFDEMPQSELDEFDMKPSELKRLKKLKAETRRKKIHAVEFKPERMK